jgi:divalent metal cation (Fe/Co/Zn/Cd) transporter
MRVADQIGSRALRADAVESITCGYLSGVVVLGFLVQLLMPGWWWVDSATSLAIVVLLVKEGARGLGSRGISQLSRTQRVGYISTFAE